MEMMCGKESKLPRGIVTVTFIRCSSDSSGILRVTDFDILLYFPDV